MTCRYPVLRGQKLNIAPISTLAPRMIESLHALLWLPYQNTEIFGFLRSRHRTAVIVRQHDNRTAFQCWLE